MRIGILGGTFDPVHIGHLIVAEGARVKLDLSRVIFVPAGQPWLKVNQNITPAIHRVEMTRRAIMANEHFDVCSLEVERPGPSYTVDTMVALGERFGAGADFFFILGYDSLAELASWKEPARLVQLCRLVAVPRLGVSFVDLSSLEPFVPGVSEAVVQLDLPIIGISSSQIRRLTAEGLSIRYLVPDGVREYIAQENLYVAPGSGTQARGS
jgi:nicotinate-nucleotide adenylyltransferase